MKEFIKRTIKKAGEAAQSAVDKVSRREAFSHVTSKEALLEQVGRKLKDRKLILASNREPYSHVHKDGKIVCYRSPGGLTIALDSVAKAFQSVWICHGNANADFDVTDANGIVRVPPDEESYQLKRVRLTPDEIQGYYEGFSNETLWPLCHVCYVRPRFLPHDWSVYESVNQKFAQAIAETAPEGAIIFLQDYHFSRVALHLRSARPDLTTVLFWHIPWPNPEIFRILPWKNEILEGLLANDIVGFHLKYHAHNFLETVNDELECRLDWERYRVTRHDHLTCVNDYPISIDFQSIYDQAESPAVAKACRELSEAHGLQGQKVILGVDRLDYTKGVPERLEAFDRMLDVHPEHLGKVKFVQIGVPTRTDLEDYQQVVNEIEGLVTGINARYRKDGWEPILFLKGQHDFNALLPYYKLADVCVVNSLHDGMNLVAKEFVAASSNDKGVLVLSPFTGSARELEQALLVNPFDIVGSAETLHLALTMDPEDQKARLERMRMMVAENNIYAWALSILNDVIRLAEHINMPR